MGTTDVGKYRKIYPRLWAHPGFVELSDNERLVALYVLSGPQSNRIGLFKFSILGAAEDLRRSPETFAKRLAKVVATFGWRHDRSARVLFIPSWFRFNKPENENVLKGILNDIGEVPASALLEEFALNVETLPETMRATFTERLNEHLRKRSPIQEQKPERNQKHERAAPLSSLPESLFSQGVREEHRHIARRVLQLTNPDGPMRDLLDAFGEISRRENVAWTNDEATAALTVASSERRARRVGNG